VSRNPSGAATLLAMSRAVWNDRQADAVGDRIAALQPDVTHIHNTWFAMSPSVVARAHSLGPVVMTLHNYRITCANATLYRAGQVCERCVTGSAWNGLWLNCYRDPLSSSVAAATVALHRKRDTWNRNVDRFFALSDFAAELFSRAGIDKSRIDVVDNHVADPGSRPSPPSQSDYVLFVGRLSEEKGIAELADRWRRFGPASLRLVVCGDGPLRDALPSSPSLELKGWTSREETAELMLNARALVFPSRWYEGQPLTVLEAFASGLPVLGSRLGAVAGPDWSPRLDSDEEWRRGFEMLTTDAVDLASRTARDRYLTNHTEPVVVERVIAGYQRAIDDHAITTR
jgi:glycosyltransferase involved in cell wall biosynthesis